MASPFPSPAESTPDAALVQRYLEHLRVDRRLAARTLSLYSDDLERLQKVAQEAGSGLLQLQPFHLQRQVAVVRSAGHSPRTISRMLSGWRGFYQWALRQGLLQANPARDIHAPKSKRPLPKALSTDEAVQLASWRKPAADARKSAGQGASGSSEEEAWLQARDAAMTELLYSCGLRIGELLGLQTHPSAQAQQQGRGWIDWQDHMIHVMGKGSKWRSVPIGQEAMQALQDWLQLRSQGLTGGKNERDDGDDADALFISRLGRRLSPQNAWKRLRQRSQQAGLAQPVHPHMLRHSFASHILQSSGDLRAVQDMLGHANIGTTQVYTRLDFQHLSQTYDAAHPRARKTRRTAEQGGEKPAAKPAKTATTKPDKKPQ